MSDQEQRQLERLAATGDEQAAAKLTRHQERSPTCPDKHIGPWKEVCKLPIPPIPWPWDEPVWVGTATHEICEHCGVLRPYFRLITSFRSNILDIPNYHLLNIL